MSESDTDPMNSTAYPRIYPNQFIPPGRTESQPNVSGSGFIDEHTYIGPGMRPQSLKMYSDTRIAGITESFERMKMEINEWNTLIGSRLYHWMQSMSKLDHYLNYLKIWLVKL